jgi:anti-sigma B factor antagonist
VHLTWEGDLDIASAPVLGAAVRVLADVGVRTVSLDTSRVAFLDCSGLGALLGADDRLPDGLRLGAPSRAVRRLLGLVGLADRFPVADDVPPASGLRDIRASIEQSRGLVMATFHCTADQASKILVSTALRHNVQVQVLADLLVRVTSSDLGHLDGGPAIAVQRVLGHPTITA